MRLLLVRELLRWRWHSLSPCLCLVHLLLPSAVARVLEPSVAGTPQQPAGWPAKFAVRASGEYPDRRFAFALAWRARKTSPPPVLDSLHLSSHFSLCRDDDHFIHLGTDG